MLDGAIGRTLETYRLMSKGTQAIGEGTQAKVSNYLKSLFEAGETDPERLTVSGLIYLRELDGRGDPAKAGFSGL